jgi:hypothetical protein
MSFSDVVSGDIQLHYSTDEGIHICCSRKIALKLNEVLLGHDLKCSDATIAILGKPNMHDVIELTVVECSNIKEVLDIITSFLSSAGIIYSTDYHTIDDDDDGDESIQLTLNNYSVFDR